MDRKVLREQIDALFSAKNYDEINELLTENKEVAKSDRDLLKVYYMLPIYEAEKEAGQRTIFSKVSSLEDLLEREVRLKFYLRRIAFDILDDEDEFYLFCRQNRVSLAELFMVAYCNAVHREKVQEFVQRKMAEGKLVV